VKSVEEMVNVIESNVELRVKSVEDMVNVIESHVELRVSITLTMSSTDFTLNST
jgi:hypothetical protein